jgi:RNA polymerase sigma-70 factor, ECF subfamily
VSKMGPRAAQTQGRCCHPIGLFGPHIGTMINQLSFEQRMRTCYPVVYARVVRIVGNQETAEDVMQESMVAAWQKQGQLRELAKLEGWFCQIASRQALAAARAQRRSVGDIPMDMIDVEAGGPDPAEAAELSEQAAIVWQTLALLSPQQRAVFVMCAVEELSLKEAASCLEITTGSAKRHLRRARDKLREKLSPGFSEQMLQDDKPGDSP